MDTVHVRDPVDGASVTFLGDSAEIAHLYLELAVRYRVTIKEVYRMVCVVLYGPDAFDDNWDFAAEVKKLEREQEEDNSLLVFPLPIEEALEIWLRTRDRLRWVAERHPWPAKLTALLAEIEAEMQRRLVRHIDKQLEWE